MGPRTTALLAQAGTTDDSGTGLLGPNFLEFLVLALGGALLVGNILALVRANPRAAQGRGELERAPVGRSLVMAGIGFVAALWALASLVSG